MSDKSNKKRKPYERPALKKLTPEEAKKLLHDKTDNARDADSEGTRKRKRVLPWPSNNPS